eukprot:COSAG01_NODE_193_length_22433_cov_91.669114_5_plen_169_part_00
MQTAGAILASPFRMVGNAASSMLPMFSPARLFSAKKAPLGDSSNDRSNQAVPAQLDVLDSASKRKVQITKGAHAAAVPPAKNPPGSRVHARPAFTQLRSDLSTEGAESLAPVKRSSPAKKKVQPPLLPLPFLSELVSPAWACSTWLTLINAAAWICAADRSAHEHRQD